jgi:proline dehydrogenase
MSVFDRLVIHGMPMVPKFIVGRVARRYVAGETLAQAIAVIQELADEGAMATIDILGEEVSDLDRAEAATREYHELYEAIDGRGLECNVSVKPTMLGLKVDESFCASKLDELVGVAAAMGNFLRIDMEDHTTIDATLRIYRQLHGEHGAHVGAVLQAYMRRTVSDIADLLPLAPNIRLCKGIYREPRTVAWKDFDTVRSNFVYALEKLLSGGAYVGIATHDPHLVWAGMTLVDRLGLDRQDYEFQMLYGVDPELRRIILDGGHRLRVYVPFGRDWYPYSMRRLRENPTVAKNVMKALLGRSAT